jgi:glucokinase
MYCVFQLVNTEVEAEMKKSDMASVITAFALKKQDVLCEQALELFGLSQIFSLLFSIYLHFNEIVFLSVSNYGSEAGNLALKTLCFGGLYIAGGIAPKVDLLILLDILLNSFIDLLYFVLRNQILSAMTESDRFYSNFLAKGRMKTLLSQVPVYIVMHPQVPHYTFSLPCCCLFMFHRHIEIIFFFLFSFLRVYIIF